MEWIKIPDNEYARNYLPKNEPFLALWKGTYCITEFDDEDDHFYICFLPAQMSGIIKVDHEREAKFTHYCKLELPKDY